MSNDIWENHQRVSGTEEQQNNREEIAMKSSLCSSCLTINVSTNVPSKSVIIALIMIIIVLVLQDGSRWKMTALEFTTRIEMQKQY